MALVTATATATARGTGTTAHPLPIFPPTPALVLALVLMVLGCSGCLASPARVEGRQPAGPAGQPATTAAPAVPRAAFDATVVRVVDGDTFVARVAGRGPDVRVRIIGVDTPETVRPGTPVACFGHAASSYSSALLAGVTVRAATEPGGDTDRYGRALWDVWLPDRRFVAAMLVSGGFGRSERVPPQTEYADLLRGLERSARAGRRGLWGPPCDGSSFSRRVRGRRPP